jgi:hypothetical protein
MEVEPYYACQWGFTPARRVTASGFASTEAENFAYRWPTFIARHAQAFLVEISKHTGDRVLKTRTYANALEPRDHVWSAVSPESIQSKHFSTINVRRDGSIHKRICIAGKIGRRTYALPYDFFG